MRRRTGAAATDTRPNMVLVLMDDFSLDLLATIPQERQIMERLRMWDDGAPAQCRAATR